MRSSGTASGSNRPVILSSGEDITERKKAEEKITGLLRDVGQEKERLSSLVNSISDEVWFADTKKNFTLANPAALREFAMERRQCEH